MAWLRLAPLAFLIVVGCTVMARPAPAPAVLGQVAQPAVATATAATPAPVVTFAPLIPAPTLAADLPPARTAAEAAQRTAAAIDALDLAAMRRLIYQGGWVFAYPGGDMSLRLTRDEAIAWMRKRTPDGRIRAAIETSPILQRHDDHPPGRVYVRSVWTAFDRNDRVRVDLVLTQDSDGAWYWSGILIGAPE